MKSLIPLVAIAVAVSSSAVFGQVAAGQGGLSGIVMDPSGARVPNAEISVENSRLGLRRSLKTTTGGVFNVSTLPPSAGYAVTITSAGFAKFQNRDITILVGQQINIVAQMQLESSAAQIDVSDTTAVETKTDVSQNVTQNQIDNLPINGRRVDSFVLLTPAVVPDGTFGLLSFRGIPGGNNFMTDGNDTTQTFYNENAGRTRIPTQISQDAVQEFQVLSDGYSAEYGRALGGVVNTITRSGTNQTHGTAFEFFRNRSFNARDPFSTINPEEERHQFGGSLGGALMRNHLFYFFNTENQIRDFPLVSSIIRPTAIDSATQTWLGCGVAGGGLPAATPAQCAAINSILPRFFGILPRTANQQTAFGKIDWRPNDKNSFSFNFNYTHFQSPNGIQTGAVVTSGGAINSNGIADVGIRYGRAAWTWVPSSNLVNEMRFGWFKDRQADSLNSELLNPVYGALSVSANGQAVGSGNYIPRIQPSESRFQLDDNLSYSWGRHSLKFGVQYFNTEDYTNQLVNGNGSYTYPNANAFALDYSGNTAGRKSYSSFAQAFGNRAVDVLFNEVNLYAQDQFRVTSKLTLNYGIRYERTFMPTPPLVNPTYTQTGRIAADGLNFAPRIGFAYSLNKDRTVVRGGYGVYYARYPGAMMNSLFTTNNMYQSSITLQPSIASQVTAAPVFPSLLSSPAGTPGAATIGFAAPDMRTPYSQQGNFSIQHALNPKTSVTISYLWSRAAQMLTVRDLNLPNTPSHSITYNLLDSTGANTGTFTTPVYLSSDKLDPNFARIIQVDNGGNSYYNALAVQVQRRYARGFEGGLSYTWSHAIDNNMGNAGGNLFLGNNAPSTLFNGDYRREKGNASADQRHRLVVNWIYSPVFTKGTDLVSHMLVNNWQLASLTTIATGLPLTESLNVAGNLTAAQISQLGLPSGLAYTGTLNGFGGSGRVPFLGVNTLRLPNSYRTDVRLTKTLPFTERFRALFSFEVFNLTNTITYTSQTTQGFTANGLNISPAQGLGTVTASSGFPDGTNARRAQISLRLEF